MAHNPWKDQHLAGEMEYTGDGYSRRMARAIVEHEYAGMEPVPCDPEQGGCGGQAHYRATVGIHQCPQCRTMFHANGAAL